MLNSRSGRGWAYFTMLLMLAVSIAGNIAHTLHINPDPSVRQLVYAVFWPFMVWLAVEMFVRVPWQDRLVHWVVRWGGILIAASIAALVSYRHLRGLLLADGEEWIVYTFGPLAIDGLMLMATLALLLTRRTTVPAVAPPLTIEEELERITLADMLPQPVSPGAPFAWTQGHTDTVESGGAVLDTGMTESAERTRRTRTNNGEREALVREMLADPELKPANSTMRRYASVARTLRDNADAEIDLKGVRPEIVENIIRPWARLERVR